MDGYKICALAVVDRTRLMRNGAAIAVPIWPQRRLVRHRPRQHRRLVLPRHMAVRASNK